MKRPFKHFKFWAEVILTSWPESFPADDWYEAMAMMLGERSPA